MNSYKHLSSPSKYDCATSTLLTLLLAYDKSNGKRNDILSAAERLSEWLYEESLNNINVSRDIALLNKLQIIKRKRKLNKEEKNCLRFIINSDAHPLKSKIGANLLLDKLKEVDRLLELITEEEKEEIKKYPIFRFYSDQSKSHEE